MWSGKTHVLEGGDALVRLQTRCQRLATLLSKLAIPQPVVREERGEKPKSEAEQLRQLKRKKRKDPLQNLRKHTPIKTLNPTLALYCTRT